MKNKGFVLMETIVVIVVISVALLTLFSSYNKILSKVKAENKYDTPEYIYMTYYVKEFLPVSTSVEDMNTLDKGPTDLSIKLGDLKSLFNIEKVYIIKGIGGTNTTESLKKFDAYMIDYIKQMDVDIDKAYLIIKYKRLDREVDSYEQKKMYKGDGTTDSLSKTYIASLEW